MALPCHYCLKWNENNARCAKCKSVFYCCKECQTKDWKETRQMFGMVISKHESVCHEKEEEELQYRDPDDIQEEAKRTFPNVEHIIFEIWDSFIKLSRNRARAFNNPDVGCTFDETAEWSMNWFMTFRNAIQEKAEIDKLRKFSPMIESSNIGQIMPRKHSGKGLQIENCDFSQTLRNHPAIKLNMFMGETYLAVGFVDLTQLLVSNIDDSGTDKPVHYVGIEMDYEKFTRAHVIYGMMKNQECSDLRILQVMYSYLINRDTLKFIKISAQNFLDNNNWAESPYKKNKVLRMMRHFHKADLRAEVLDYVFEEMSLNNILRSHKEKLAFFDFCYRHSLFLDSSETAIGNPTMYSVTPPDGERPLQSFFRMFDLSWLESVKDENDFFQAIQRHLLRKMQKLRALIFEGKLECTFILKQVGVVSSMEDDATMIRNFNASVIDWSNLIDYFNTQDFVEWIQTCGSPRTVHVLYSVDWNQSVYGCLPQFFLTGNNHLTVFDAARRQIRLDLNRLLESKPYLKKVFYEDGLIIHTQPLVEMVWFNYMKMKYLEFLDNLGRESKRLRVMKISNTDQIHVPANYFTWGFDAVLMSDQISPEERWSLTQKYVQM